MTKPSLQNSRKFVVGCPVHRREWIFAKYLEHVLVACDNAGVEPSFVFVGTEDDPSWAEIPEGLDVSFVHLDEPREAIARHWSVERFNYMGYLRNIMLKKVRDIGPDVFLSLDSDILLHEDALRLGLETLGEADAVGLGCYMTPVSKAAPNYGYLKGTKFVRGLAEHETAAASVLMAAVLMSQKAYNVDYEDHSKGEDIGWSIACGRANLKFLWDNRRTSKHVMGPEWLERDDPRVS